MLIRTTPLYSNQLAAAATATPDSRPPIDALALPRSASTSTNTAASMPSRNTAANATSNTASGPMRSRLLFELPPLVLDGMPHPEHHRGDEHDGEHRDPQLEHRLAPCGQATHGERDDDAGLIRDPWVGGRPLLPDTLPVIDRIEGRANAFVSTGHGMLGVTLGSASGRALAEFIRTGPRPGVLEPFRFERG